MWFLKVFLSGLLLLFSSFLYCQHENAGTTGFAFMKMQYSARAMGMANSFVGLSNDGDAVFFNTAGLVLSDTRHLKTSYMNYIDGMHGGSMVYVTDGDAGWKVAPFVQFLVSDAIPEAIVTNGIIEEVGTFHTSDILFGLGFARKVHDALDVGFNLKYYYQNLAGDNATVLAADFSVLHQTQNENLTIGASLKNVGVQLSYFSEEKYEEDLPLMGTVGASYNFSDKVHLNFDLCRPFDHDFFGRVGFEYNYNPHFSFRAGYDTRGGDYQTDESFDFASGLASGVGFAWNQYLIDYAVFGMGGLGFVHQVSVSYKF